MNDGRDNVRYHVRYHVRCHVRSDVRSGKFVMFASCNVSVSYKFYVRLLGLFKKVVKNGEACEKYSWYRRKTAVASAGLAVYGMQE